MAEYFWDRTLTKCLCCLFVNEVARRQPYTNCTWPRFINVKSSSLCAYWHALHNVQHVHPTFHGWNVFMKIYWWWSFVMQLKIAFYLMLNDRSSSTVRWREPFFILCVIGGGVSRTVHPVIDSLLHFQVVRPIHYVPTDFHWAIGIILTCTTCTRFWFNSVYFFLDIVNIWVFSLNIVYYVEMVVCVR